MTDEQFDETCRSALAYEPGLAREAAWSKIRPTRWKWLPTVPEILACGCACACGLVLFAIGFRSIRNLHLTSGLNPVVQKATEKSFLGLQASTFQIPDATSWSEDSFTLPTASGLFTRHGW